MKKVLFSTLFILINAFVFAQSGVVKGKVFDKTTSQYPSGLELKIVELKSMRFTNSDGEFVYYQIPYGDYTLEISDGIRLVTTLKIYVQSEIVDLGEIEVENISGVTINNLEQLASIGLDDNISESDDDGVNSENFSSVLTASRDPFLQAAAFTFGPLRFQMRGFMRNQQKVFINYIPMNEPENGNATWSQWGGLNEVFRNQNNTFALNPSEFGIEGLQGITGIDITAASQRKQTKIAYSFSNRSYRHRLMVTHSTGIMENGWAFSVSGSRRYANEGYVPGTFYDGYSYYLGASKLLNSKSSLHFVTFGAPTRRGKQGPSTQEAMDLAGSNYYNPNWGYQNGEIRNAKVADNFIPTAMMTYEYNKNPFESLNISLGFQKGYMGNSTLDWYNAQDPRPDYYRNLPSYYLEHPNGADPQTAEDVRNEIVNNPDRLQIDWDRLYQANYFNTQSFGGITGKRSIYALANDRDDITKYNASLNYKKVLNDNVVLHGGLNLERQETESYREMLDLLGGDYWVNVNQFAERTYIGNDQYLQNDLNNPNSIIREGDKYMYHYKSYFTTGNAWAQTVMKFNKVDFFVGASATYKSIQREGMYKSGIFQEDSYGKSDALSFFTYDIKGGLTYKINGRNYLYANMAYFTEAPTFDNSFVAPRVRNLIVDDLKTEKVASIEGGYLLHTPYINARVSGFISQFEDITQIKRFYHDDYRTFVNYVMSDIAIRNMGVELATQFKISPSLSASVVAIYNDIFYTSRPNITVYRDNDTLREADKTIAYMQNYHVATGPQSAYTVGLNYRSPKFWYASINFNYMDRNYLDINPVRLTEEATDLMDRNSEEFKYITAQEKLPAFYTIDVSLGKSIMLNNYFKKINRNHMIYINLGVNNVTNNKEVITGGFNQLRYDIANRNPDRFPPKYFYGFGANYFLNISYKF